MLLASCYISPTRENEDLEAYNIKFTYRVAKRCNN